MCSSAASSAAPMSGMKRSARRRAIRSSRSLLQLLVDAVLEVLHLHPRDHFDRRAVRRPRLDRRSARALRGRAPVPRRDASSASAAAGRDVGAASARRACVARGRSSAAGRSRARRAEQVVRRSARRRSLRRAFTLPRSDRGCGSRSRGRGRTGSARAPAPGPRRRRLTISIRRWKRLKNGGHSARRLSSTSSCGGVSPSWSTMTGVTGASGSSRRAVRHEADRRRRPQHAVEALRGFGSGQHTKTFSPWRRPCRRAAGGAQLVGDVGVEVDLRHVRTASLGVSALDATQRRV